MKIIKHIRTIWLTLFLQSGIIGYAQTQQWIVPSEWKTKVNPTVSTQNSVEKGKKIYHTLCAPCHGEKGKGNGYLSVTLNPRPANHSHSVFQKQKDGEIYYKITTGRNAMPSYRKTLTEEQIWNITNFIRTLGSEKNIAAIQTHSSVEIKSITEKKPEIETHVKTETPVISKGDTLVTTVEEQKKDTILSETEKSISVDTVLSAVESFSSSASKSNFRRKFILTGSAHFNVIMGGEKLSFNSTGFETGFLPVLLWQPSKRLFFESHLHISAGAGNAHTNNSSGSTGGHSHGSVNTSTIDGSESSSNSTGAAIMLSYANLVYFVNNYVSLTAGLFLSPFGIYSERMHPEWINKLPDAPLGLGHSEQLFPEKELGIQLRGGLPIRKMRMNYSLYISNGPSLITTGIDAGKLDYEDMIDNNNNKAIGGRLGILPLANSSLETGFSIQRAKVGTTNTPYSRVDALLWAADVSYKNSFSFIQGTLDIKGQYSSRKLDKVYYYAEPELTLHVPAIDVNLNDSTYRFDNTSSAYFIMVAYRPVMSEKFLKNIEFIFRYDEVRTPCYALWNSDKTRWSAGLTYWLESRSALKLAFASSETEKLLIFQFVIGL